MPSLNLTQARDIGHAYASFVATADPGITLYAFASTGRVQSEAHRSGLVAYLDDHAKPAAVLNDDAGDLDTFTGGTNADDIAALRAFILSAPLS